MCLGFEDEVDCSLSKLVTILPTAMILIISFLLAIYDLWFLRGDKLLNGVRLAQLSLLPSASKSMQESRYLLGYRLITPDEYESRIRGHQEYKESLQNLVSWVGK